MKQDETIYGHNLPRKNLNSPEQQYSEQYFKRNYNPDSKYLQKEMYRKYPDGESSRNAIVPDDSRQLEFRNIPNSASSIFYNGKSYTSNRKIENMADNMWPENKHKLTYFSKKSNAIDPSDSNDWYMRKNHQRDFVNRKVERGLFNDDDAYRVNRQKVLDEDTIQETAIDENTYDEAGLYYCYYLSF